MADNPGKAVELVLLVQVYEEFGQARLKAEVCRPNPNEREAAEYPFLSTSWSYGGFEAGAEFDGFAATAYVGDGGNTWGSRDPGRGVWGVGVAYAPHRIETARHAQAIARVLGRIERGLAKAQESDGYLADGDFAGHVLRIARILRLSGVHVRNSARNRTFGGERYRKVTGSALQAWVADVTESVTKGTHRADYLTV